MINFVIKSAFITGALTAGAFVSGVAIGVLVNKDKVINKVKKMQIKKIMQLQPSNVTINFYISQGV